MSMFNFIGICWSEDFSMPITHNIYLDPITPGWRKGEGYSSAIEGWSEQVNPASFEDFFIILWLICCKATILGTPIIMCGLPEIILYTATFYHIFTHNKKTALAGILNSDAIKRRKQQNMLNMRITFWAWIAQLGTNITYLILLTFFFGKHRFFHKLLAISTICLNFNILPIFYLTMADEDLKLFLLNKDYFNLLKLFLGL